MGKIHIKTCLMTSFESSPFELTCSFVLLHTTQINLGSGEDRATQINTEEYNGINSA